MPLQVAADTLLSTPACPEEMVMEMDCCPNANDLDSVKQCETAKSCHLCKTPVQIYLYSHAPFASLSKLSAYVKTPPLILAIFNPASIWRPPNLS